MPLSSAADAHAVPDSAYVTSVLASGVPNEFQHEHPVRTSRIPVGRHLWRPVPPNECVFRFQFGLIAAFAKLRSVCDMSRCVPSRTNCRPIRIPGLPRRLQESPTGAITRFTQSRQIREPGDAIRTDPLGDDRRGTATYRYSVPTGASQCWWVSSATIPAPIVGFVPPDTPTESRVPETH